MRDRITTGALLGLGADAVKLSFNYLAYRLGFTPIVFWQIVATHFLRGEDLFHPLAYLIGAIADLTVAMFLGVVFFLIIPYIGSHWLWLKGAGFGLLVWVGLFGILTSHVAEQVLPWEPRQVLVTPFAHLLFGLVLGLLARIAVLREEKKAP